ncbi:MAG TPA: acyltransferase [Solirubrobacteraceae bacterium]|nr:acyltransferase [Solirubrobacteraceae bacterium]
MAKKDLTPERFGGLDALRALAALSIVLFHAVGIYARGSAPDAWTHDWVARLDVGVPIFFLLSGFLLYRPFVRARAAGEEPRLRAYAWRRFLRIFPGYWVALVVAVLALGLSGALAPRYLLLLQSYSKDTVAGGLPQAWTLCVEVAFYAFLPLWAAFVRRTAASELPALAALFAVSLAYKLVVLGAAVGTHVGAVDPWIIALPAYWDMFAMGMALAVVSTRRAIPGHPAAWWLAAALLFVLSAKGAGLAHPSAEGFTHAQVLVRHYLYAAIAFCVLAAALTGPRPLEVAPLQALGRISYGIYLYHLTVLGLLGKWDLAQLEDHVHPYILWSTFGIAGTLVLATASWFAVERPALSLRGYAGPRLREPRPSG